MSAIAVAGPYRPVPCVQGPTAEAAILTALELPGYPDGMTMADLMHRTGRGWDEVYGAVVELLRLRRIRARECKSKGQTVLRYRLARRG